MADSKPAIEKLLVREGGFVDDPDDRGGETNFGISSEAHPDVDVRNLTAEKAARFYLYNYWQPLKLEWIKSQDLAEAWFDFAVNSGLGRATKYVQKLIGAEVDGVVGPETIGKANAVEARWLVEHLTFERVVYVAKIAKRRPPQRKFLPGWIFRILEVGGHKL